MMAPNRPQLSSSPVQIQYEKPAVPQGYWSPSRIQHGVLLKQYSSSRRGGSGRWAVLPAGAGARLLGPPCCSSQKGRSMAPHTTLPVMQCHDLHRLPGPWHMYTWPNMALNLPPPPPKKLGMQVQAARVALTPLAAAAPKAAPPDTGPLPSQIRMASSRCRRRHGGTSQLPAAGWCLQGLISSWLPQSAPQGVSFLSFFSHGWLRLDCGCCVVLCYRGTAGSG